MEQYRIHMNKTTEQRLSLEQWKLLLLLHVYHYYYYYYFLLFV